MATPTQMKPAPSQSGRTPSGQQQQYNHQGRTPQLAAPTPPVSTPFSSNAAHAAFSPNGPRSSPQHFKKSPAAASMLMGHPSQTPLNFDSPNTAAAMGALGMGGGLDLGLDAVGVGGLAGLGGLSGEDYQIKRLDTILDIIGKRTGYVSEAGLERLAQRIGLESLADEQTTADGRKVKNLIIAGNFTSIDIVLDNNIVESVTLGFPESAESVVKRMDPASSILLKDLQLEKGQSPLTKTLDKFAVNLERLAILDKLSILPALDCRQALAGVYESLEKLHQWDMAQLKADEVLKEKSDDYLRLMAMCSRNGYPVMHARDRVGLAIQYWREKRFTPPSTQTESVSQDENVWSLLINVAPTQGLEVPPLRISEDWISKDIIRPDPLDQTRTELDWQEPPNISLPQDSKDNVGIDMIQPDLSMTRVPQVTFTVTFDPPIILPQNDWVRLYGFVNSNPPQLFGYPPTFDALFFPLLPAAGGMQDPSELRIIPHTREVSVYEKALVGSQGPEGPQGPPQGPQGRLVRKVHHNRLFIYKQIYSMEVREMMFSHPRQLIGMLGLLRQYALIAGLLQKSFGTQKEHLEGKSDAGDVVVNGSEARIQDELEELLSLNDDAPTTSPTSPANDVQTAGSTKEQNPAATKADLTLDVILWVHPSPHFQVSFPFRGGSVSFTIHILENAVVEITEEDLIARVETEGGQGERKPLTRRVLAEGLEHLEDFCKWAEWIRMRWS